MTAPRPYPRCIVTALLLSAVACGADHAVVLSSSAAADSTGPVLQHWVVDSVASVTMGSVGGNVAHQLSNITGVVRMQNGHIAAFDDGSMQLRFFDSTGKHVATHGRAGQGPGEFRNAGQLAAVGGDTVMVVDAFQSRRVWVSAGRGHVDTRRYVPQDLRAPLTDTMLVGEEPNWIGDSTLAWKGLRRSTDYRGPDGEPGFSHDLFYVIDQSSNRAIQLVDWQRERGRAVQVSNGTRELFPVQSVYPRFVADYRNGRICAAQPRVAEIRCMNADGTELRIMWTPEAIPYPDSMRTVAMAASLERSLRNAKSAQDSIRVRADLEKMYAGREWIPHWLPMETFDVDADGNFWVLEHTQPSGRPEQKRYRVFNRKGEHIAFATTFAARPYEIGSTSVIGVYRDADDVQRIGVFRIHKSSVPPR